MVTNLNIIYKIDDTLFLYIQMNHSLFNDYILYNYIKQIIISIYYFQRKLNARKCNGMQIELVQFDSPAPYLSEARYNLLSVICIYYLSIVLLKCGRIIE